LAAIKHLLYGEGYTIKGVQRLFKEQGARGFAAKTQRSAPLADVDSARPASPLGPETSPAVGLGGDDGLSHAEIEALRSALGDLAEASRILAHGRAG
jgi:hypothetical protein